MQTIEIKQSESGAIRVFAISRPIADMARALKQKPKAALADEMLGHPVTVEDIELFALSDLTGVGLPRYLSDGYDVDSQALRRDRARLDALDGYVLLVFSSVAADGDVRLSPGPDLTLIGTYHEARAQHAAGPIAVEAAKPYTGTNPAPKAPGRSRVGSALTAVLALMIMILIWWSLT